MTTRGTFISMLAAAVLLAGAYTPDAEARNPTRRAAVKRTTPVKKAKRRVVKPRTRTRAAKKVPLGVVAGRFQILHKDHVKFMLAGKAKCKHLVVGITNPDPMLTKADKADPARSKARNNPLSYYERYAMVRAALKEAGLRDKDFSVVPLPVNLPKMYKNYLPKDATVFVTVFDKWGERKRQHFVDQGFKTDLLWKRPQSQKGISATTVRKAMVDGQKWDHYVPKSVAKQMRDWDIPGRLKGMAAGLEK